MHNDIEPSLDLDPAPTKIREERFFTSALDHIEPSLWGEPCIGIAGSRVR
jgi:hypothetical protein